jgi:hypothetical protein
MGDVPLASGYIFFFWGGGIQMGLGTVPVVQGFWKGVLPSLVMVSNPTVQYVLYEWLTSQLIKWKKRSGAGIGQDRCRACASWDGFVGGRRACSSCCWSGPPAWQARKSVHAWVSTAR